MRIQGCLRHDSAVPLSLKIKFFIIILSLTSYFLLLFYLKSISLYIYIYLATKIFNIVFKFFNTYFGSLINKDRMKSLAISDTVLKYSLSN